MFELSKTIPYQDVLKNKLLKDFHECEDLKRKKLEELSCLNCGEIEQDPEYQSICGVCGHLK